MYQYNFEKLEVWTLSIDLAKEIYNLTKSFPAEERFGITNQLRRASTSISANIAEGTTRLGEKDKARFIQIAFSSTAEVLNFLILAKELEFLNEEKLTVLRKKILEITNKLNALHKTILAK